MLVTCDAESRGNRTGPQHCNMTMLTTKPLRYPKKGSDTSVLAKKLPSLILEHVTIR